MRQWSRSKQRGGRTGRQKCASERGRNLRVIGNERQKPARPNMSLGMSRNAAQLVVGRYATFFCVGCIPHDGGQLLSIIFSCTNAETGTIKGVCCNAGLLSRSRHSGCKWLELHVCGFTRSNGFCSPTYCPKSSGDVGRVLSRVAKKAARLETW